MAVAAPPPGTYWAASTRQMAERLAGIARATPVRDDPADNRRRAQELRSAIGRTPDPAARAPLRYQLADQLIQAGEVEAAVAEIRALQELPPAERRHVRADWDHALLDLLGLAYLRLGETENCIAHHTAESCLLPIRGAGVHVDRRGSRAAMAAYQTLLQQRPDHLIARWLLNIAAMTVGEYPGGVPAPWRIPPAAFAAEADVRRFREVAGPAGLGVRGHAGGSLMEDLDGDGLLDVMTSSEGLHDPLHLHHNNGDGTFSERTAAAGLAGLAGGLNLVHADYDNDGDVDVLVLRGAWRRRGGRLPNSLLRNRGDGTFDDVTEAAGLLTFHPTQVGAWGDFDGDGWLDLFVGNESTPGDPHPSELWRNLGNGRFRDVSALLLDPDLGYVKGAAWGDIDNDGDPDLFVSVMFGQNRLFRNDRGRFTEIAQPAGVTEPQMSFATWFWDYDNDGWEDLFMAGFNLGDPGDTAALYLGLPQKAALPRLYRNRGDGTFADVTRAARLDRVAVVMGANFGDLDNDGWLDCYLGTGTPDLRTLVPNRMFRNDGGRRFQDVTTSGGFGHLQKGHGISFGDIDNDGDQDVHIDIGGVVASDVGQNALFANPGHGHRFITLRLEGRRSNRSAIGARVRVRVRGRAGARDIHVTVGTGGSFGGSSLQQEIGLGPARAIEEVEVRWPSGLIERLRGLALDRVYRVVEGEGAARPVAVRRIRLGG